MTDIRLSLSPSGDIRLTLRDHKDRTLDVPATETGARFIQRILRDAASGRRDQPGYIGTFPTQAIIDQWLRMDRALQREAVREEFKEKGIDLAKMEFRL